MITVLPNRSYSTDNILGIQLESWGNNCVTKINAPIFCLATSNSYPDFLCIPLPTPEPMTGLGFAVFTTASTCIFTISFRTISKGIGDLLVQKQVG